MKIDLKCFATLVEPGSCDFRDSTAYTLADGQTVADLARVAGIAEEDIKIAFVNSRVVTLDSVLSDGDRVGFAPAVGGM
jgi:molybdopterin converting factor small subunit